MSLKGLRVLEVGSLAAASYCARLFADFGADVLKFEMRGGDPLRHAAPMVATEQGAASAWFAFLNFGKRLAQEDDARFVELIAEAAPRIVALVDQMFWARLTPDERDALATITQKLLEEPS